MAFNDKNISIAVDLVDGFIAKYGFLTPEQILTTHQFAVMEIFNKYMASGDVETLLKNISERSVYGNASVASKVENLALEQAGRAFAQKVVADYEDFHEQFKPYFKQAFNDVSQYSEERLRELFSEDDIDEALKSAITNVVNYAGDNEIFWYLDIDREMISTYWWPLHTLFKESLERVMVK